MSAHTGRRLLLVESDALSRDMLQRRLSKRGFEVLVASDGEEGVALTRRERPDLVLLEMALPSLDGLQATQRLKNDASTREIPVVMLTSHALAEDRARAMAAGCAAFDTKPVDLTRLLDTIEALLPPVPSDSA